MTEIIQAGSLDLKLLAAKLRVADPKLKRELRQNLKRLAEPIRAKVQYSILDMPSHHDSTLRVEVARTVSVSTAITKTGIRMDMSPTVTRCQAGKGELPAYLDRDKGWKHPVFAQGERFRKGLSHARKYRGMPASQTPLVNRGNWTWVHQEGKPGWFEHPVAASGRELQAACQAALDKTAAELEA